MSPRSVAQAVHRAENIAPEVMDAVISDMPVADFVADTAEKTYLAGGVRNFLRPLPCP